MIRVCERKKKSPESCGTAPIHGAWTLTVISKSCIFNPLLIICSPFFKIYILKGFNNFGYTMKLYCHYPGHDSRVRLTVTPLKMPYLMVKTFST